MTENSSPETAPSTAAAETASVHAPSWTPFAAERLLEAAKGIESWRRELDEEFEPRTVLKLRAHARRFERYAEVFETELANAPFGETVRSAVPTAQALIEALSPLRDIDLQSDYFDDVEEGLDETRAAEAAAHYSKWLWRKLRLDKESTTQSALTKISVRPLKKAQRDLNAVSKKSPHPPTAADGAARLAIYEQRCFELIAPLVETFDQSTLEAASLAARDLRYAWKALRPCYPAATYELNHGHTHRLQEMLGNSRDIERWVQGAADFAEGSFARGKGIRPRDWERVLRFAWAHRLNLLHQVGRHALVRSWLEAADKRSGMLRIFRPDLRQG